MPASFRKQLGLQAGDSLSFRLEGNRLVMTSKAVALAELRGLLPPLPDGRLASEELIAERRQEALREEVER